MVSTKILVVEDSPTYLRQIAHLLREEGFEVITAVDGEDALEKTVTENPDLIVLDIILPKKNGFQVCRQLKTSPDTQNIKILMLTSKSQDSDRFWGLKQGADDYMTKPFDLVELVARLRALIRRSRGRATPVIEWGALVLDPSRRSVSFEGQPVELSPREYAVLETLLEHGGRVVSRSRLAESVYSWDNDIESNALEVYIHHLRKKLTPDLIRTVRGVGYMLREQK